MKKFFLLSIILFSLLNLFGQHNGKSGYLVQTLDSISFTKWRAESYKYDSLGRNTERHIRMYEMAINGYFDIARYEYEHDSLDRLTVMYHYECDYPFAGWYYKNKLEYHYDQSGRDSVIYTLKWDSPSTSWMDYRKQTYSYNAAGKVAEILFYSWQSGTQLWRIGGRALHYYDTNDQIFEDFHSMYNHTTSNWDPLFRNLYGVDSNNNVVSWIYQEWGFWHTGAWGNLFREISAYDSNGNLAESVGSDFDPVYGWMFGGKAIHTYDPSFSSSKIIMPVAMRRCEFFCDTMIMRNNKILHYVNYVYTHQNTWVPKGDSTQFFYSDFNTGIEKAAPLPAITIYPNPGSENVNITGLNPGESYRAVVYGMTGTVVGVLPVNNGIVNVAGLKSGMYILEVRSDMRIAGKVRFIRI